VKNKIIAITGPTQIGKDTLLKNLEKDSRFKILRTCTTRQMREGEQEGIDYYYLSGDMFQQKILNNEFIEWDYTLHNYYGILRHEFLPDQQKVIILCCLSRIALRLQTRFDWIVPVFLYPDNLLELKDRIRDRFHEPHILQERMDHLDEEMRHSVMFRYVCKSDSKISTLDKFMNLFKFE
jgi:guanylate kinase